MNLHIEFNSRDLEKSFPDELGIIRSDTVDAEIYKVFYYLNGKPLIDTETYRGTLNAIKGLNFFIGTNNCGKSRFLRSLFKIEYFYVSQEGVSPVELLNKINENKLIAKQLSFGNGLGGDIASLWSDMGNPFVVHDLDSKENEFTLLVEKYQYELKKARIINLHVDQVEFCLNIINNILKFIKSVKFHRSNKLSHLQYIPILRTLISDGNFQSDTFNKIISNKYHLKKNVFTGQDIYDQIFKLHNSTRIVELKAFCLWIRDNFYKQHHVELIPNGDTRDVFLQIDDIHRPIYDLGDGIQQLILLMFPIYTSEDNTWFFIEEPETHLHPGLQRIFIETLLTDTHIKKKNLKFFFTTHSNHFLDLSIENESIAIFQFEKENPERYNIKSNVKPSKEVLDLLGVKSSSVFLANTSIWVEGPTDRKYLSKFIKLYCECKGYSYLREDIDFAFFEYGGNLIEHYLFDDNFEEEFTEDQVRNKIKAFALSNKVYLLADNDNVVEGTKKYNRRKNLEKISSKYFKYQNTEYREVENLLPVNILKDFMPQIVLKEELTEITKIDFKRTDYIHIGLGEFMSNKFSEAEIIGKKFKSKTGDTLDIVYKNKLCDFIINSSYKYSELIEDNEYLDILITDLYNFIKS